jgi:uncharacterized membrane protein YcaP (DUF421 family)
VCGKVSIIIENGKILEDELEKNQYTIADLMTQLRKKDVFMIQDVKYAIIETNGDLNVIKMDQNMDKMPLNIIEDGKLNENNMEILNYDTEKVNSILKKEKVKLENILIGTVDTNNKFLYQLKEVKK